MWDRMSAFEAIVVEVFSYHLSALEEDLLEEDDVEVSVKLSALVTVTVPIFFILISLFVLLGDGVSERTWNWLFGITVVLVVFGVSAITDAIFDKKETIIRQRAVDIRDDAGRGPSWARRRILIYYFGFFAVAGVLVTGAYFLR